MLITEYPDISSEAMTEVQTVIDNVEVSRLIEETIQLTGSIPEIFVGEDSAKKVDELLANFIHKLTGNFGVSLQNAIIIGYIVLQLIILIPKKPIENFFHGDGVKSLTEKVEFQNEKQDSTHFEVLNRFNELKYQNTTLGTVKKACFLFQKNNTGSAKLLKLGNGMEVYIISRGQFWVKVRVPYEYKEYVGYIPKGKIKDDF